MKKVVSFKRVVTAMTGHDGWPLRLFLTADRRLSGSIPRFLTRYLAR